MILYYIHAAFYHMTNTILFQFHNAIPLSYELMTKGNSVTRQLHEESFKLHQELAVSLAINSFRTITALNVQESRVKSDKNKNAASWLDRKVVSSVMDKGTYFSVVDLQCKHDNIIVLITIIFVYALR